MLGHGRIYNEADGGKTRETNFIVTETLVQKTH